MHDLVVKGVMEFSRKYLMHAIDNSKQIYKKIPTMKSSANWK